MCWLLRFARDNSRVILGLLMLPWAAPAEEVAVRCVRHEVQTPLIEAVWVETETARVLATIEASADPGKSGSLRGEVLDLLRKLIPEEGDSWRFTSASLSRDPSGLERWQLRAEIRTLQAKLPGLQAKAEKLSKPGLHVFLAIDWTPSVAEVEAAKAKARLTIYQRAVDEVKRLNDQLGFAYRVADIRFGEPGRPSPLQAKALAAEAVEALPRAEQQVVEAIVTLREVECEDAADRRTAKDR